MVLVTYFNCTRFSIEFEEKKNETRKKYTHKHAHNELRSNIAYDLSKKFCHWVQLK